MKEKDLEEAHKHSSYNKQELEQSEVAACFCCLKKWDPRTTSIKWTDKGQTAICPFCDVDSVLGSASGLTLDDSFLKQMREYWFDGGGFTVYFAATD